MGLISICNGIMGADAVRPPVLFTDCAKVIASSGASSYLRLIEVMELHRFDPAKYDSDIDSQIDSLPNLQSHAKNNQEEPTPATDDSEDVKLSQNTNRTDFEPKSDQNPAE